MKTINLILFYTLVITIVNAQPRNLKSLEVMFILNEINTARENPTCYSTNNNLKPERLDSITSKSHLILDYKLCQKADNYSTKLSKLKYNPNYIICDHSTMGYNESIALNPRLDEIVYSLILDKNVKSKGHRFHLLGVDNNDTKIGIGVSYIKQLDWYIVVIITDK